MQPTDAERIARLEAQQQEGERVHQALFDRLDDQQEQLGSISKDVSEINRKLSGYRGFFGGIAFMLTAMGGLIGAALMTLWHSVVGGGGGQH